MGIRGKFCVVRLCSALFLVASIENAQAKQSDTHDESPKSPAPRFSLRPEPRREERCPNYLQIADELFGGVQNQLKKGINCAIQSFLITRDLMEQKALIEGVFAQLRDLGVREYLEPVAGFESYLRLLGMPSLMGSLRSLAEAWVISKNVQRARFPKGI
jgi:hypothetical protein